MLSRRPCVAAIAVAGMAGAAAAQVPAWHQLPTTMPSATQQLAFDAHRERMVRVDGHGHGDVFFTWEWLGDDWSLRRTATRPPARAQFALGFDPLRRRVVLFGGQTLVGLLNDTWEYDGIDWVQVTPAASPPPLASAWLGFDHVRNQLLLCGGGGAWHYDGATWTAAAPPPFSVPDAAIASDPLQQRIIAFVGTAPSRTFGWDGTAWSQLGPAFGFGPDRARAAFVAQRQRIVRVGGYVSGYGWSTSVDEWTGTAWTPVPSAAFPERQSHSACHDPVRNRLFVVGGSGPVGLGVHTSQWDGANWSLHAPGLGTEWTSNAYFDFNRQAVCMQVLSSPAPIWVEWDGRVWRRSVSPITLDGPQLAFDIVRARAVLVGAVIGAQQTMEWDGTTWTTPAGTQLPAWTRLIWHGARGRVVACCGSSGLYEWDGTNWTSIAVGPGSPWTLNEFTMGAYDAARGELVLLKWASGSVHTATWDGATWTIASQPNGPPARSGYGITYDEDRQRVALFGGGSLGTFVDFDDLWEWDGAVWSQRVLPNAPPPRQSTALVYDPIRQQLLVLGGLRMPAPSTVLGGSDVWALDSRPSAAVTTLGQGCGAGAPPRLVVGAPHPGAVVFPAELHSAFATAPCMFGFAFAAGATPLGAGCTSWLANQDTLMFGWTNAGGIATVAGGIPPNLSGFTFVAQAIVLDLASPLGVAITPGLQITVGR